MDLFITCQPSLEDLLADELSELGLSGTVGFAGCYVPDTWDNIYTVNYASRLAGRVLKPIHSFRFYSAEEFYEQAFQIDWTAWHDVEKTFVIHSTGRSRTFRNTLYASQLLKDAICDCMRECHDKRPSIDTKNPDTAFQLYLDGDQATIYYDTSLEPLFKRAWRQSTGPAPLQETVASALLRIAGYDGSQVLFDPCCGSATILIEAALIATHTPSGYFRKRWGFTALPDYNPAAWGAIKEAFDAKRIPLEKGRIFGCDIDAQAICAAKVNLKATGFNGLVQVNHSDCRSFEAPYPFDLVITNPPHGNRLEKQPHLLPQFRNYKVATWVFSPDRLADKAVELTVSGDPYFFNRLNIKD